MASGYDKFLSETSGMGPVPKAQGSGSARARRMGKSGGRRWGMHGKPLAAKPASHSKSGQQSQSPGGGSGQSRGGR